MSIRKLVVTSAAQVGTAVGALIALAAWHASLALRVGLAIAIVVAAGSAITFEIVALISEGAKRYPTPSRINRFMYDWISQRGHVVIFSNDMSWVSEDVHIRLRERLLNHIGRRRVLSIRDLLLDKARKKELTLCIPRDIDLSNQLRSAGARVATYERLHVIPSARFTIVRHGQQDGAVAIGRTVSGVHKIETFGNGRHPAFALAEDLVHIVLGYSQVP